MTAASLITNSLVAVLDNWVNEIRVLKKLLQLMGIYSEQLPSNVKDLLKMFKQEVIPKSELRCLKSAFRKALIENEL